MRVRSNTNLQKPNPSNYTMSLEQDRNQLIRLAKTEFDFIASVSAPLFCVTADEDQVKRVTNGTAFFLDTGSRKFAVTADHVVRTCTEPNVRVQVSDLFADFSGKNKIIDRDETIDLATFEISEAELESIGKSFFRGIAPVWPPKPPQQDQGLFYIGFPEKETLGPHNREISFGATLGGGLATSVSERDISISLMEKEKLLEVWPGGIPPDNYNYSGISGGPVLLRVQNGKILGWTLGGIIYQGPNTCGSSDESIRGFEVIRARRSHFLLADGSINRMRWSP